MARTRARPAEYKEEARNPAQMGDRDHMIVVGALLARASGQQRSCLRVE